MATRKKKVIITGVSREAADEAFATYAKSDAQVQKINADIELQCAKIRGFRTGTPKLKTLKGFTWASALELVKEFLPDYVRQTWDIAKDKLLADREGTVQEPGNPLGPGKSMYEQMAKCGMQVVQDEAFYVEPKKEDSCV